MGVAELRAAADLPKPLDIGTGTVAASFGRDGSWLSVGRPHLRHGFVELSGLPPFDERWRGDPEAVRRYRGSMTDERSAFLRLDLPGEAVAARRVDVSSLDRPVWLRKGEGWSCSSTAWGRLDESTILQRHTIEWDATADGEAVLQFRGALSLSVMPEITEVSPVAQLRGETTVSRRGGSLHLRSERLDAAAMITVTARRSGQFRWELEAGGGARLTWAGTPIGRGGRSCPHRYCWRPAFPPSQRRMPIDSTVHNQASCAGCDHPRRRAVHHLLYRDGRRWRRPGHPRRPPDTAAELEPRRLLPGAASLATEENPADDPTEFPYTLSTQILLWHTALSLASWSEELGIDGLHLTEVADAIQRAVQRRFVRPGPSGDLWAYEIDDADGHRLYQDANDLPTAFAPLLGFCAPDDPVWLATMRFALSPDNPGYVSGRYGGLGSARTPDTWTLGDAQDLAFSAVTGDRDRINAVLGRLALVAGPDGLLPETYHPDTAEWTARYWFAWPGAVIGALHLGAVVPSTRDEGPALAE